MKKVASTVLIAFVTLFAFGVLINTQTCHAQTNVSVQADKAVKEALEKYGKEERASDRAEKPANAELLSAANHEIREKLLTEEFILDNLQADLARMVARHKQQITQMELDIDMDKAEREDMVELRKDQAEDVNRLVKNINERKTNVSMLKTVISSSDALLAQKLELANRVAVASVAEEELSLDKQTKLVMEQMSNDMAFNSVEELREFVSEKISDFDHTIASDKRAWNN